MGFYKRNRSLFLTVLGTGLMAASVCWEYSRMKPDYRYWVEPWSLRGYETTQGWVILACALALAVLAVPLSLRWLKGKLLESIFLTAAVTAFATMVPVLAGSPDRTPGGTTIWGLAFLLGLAAVAVAGRLLPAAIGPYRRFVLLAVLAAVTVGAGLAFDSLLGGRAVPTWVLVLTLMLTLSVLMIARTPHELAPYRFLLVGVAATWVIALVCGGAVRTTLLRLQIEQTGISATYRDAQITSGVLIAWAGGLLAFAGSVGLWAHRRDELEERGRAGRQMAVAEISSAELQEAI